MRVTIYQSHFTIKNTQLDLNNKQESGAERECLSSEGRAVRRSGGLTHTLPVRTLPVPTSYLYTKTENSTEFIRYIYMVLQS